MAEDTQGTDTPTTAPINVPDKPALEGLEDALTRRWLDEGTYKFNPDTTREQVYSIDTPPPTASGSLHVGHMFSYTQTDVLARYQRMTGKNVFYPMGWDDNGLPTERRVQNYYGVRCDPTTAYDAGYRPAGGARQEPARLRRRLAPELHRAVRGARRRGREGLREPLPDPRPVRGLGPDLPHHR